MTFKNKFIFCHNIYHIMQYIEKNISMLSFHNNKLYNKKITFWAI